MRLEGEERTGQQGLAPRGDRHFRVTPVSRPPRPSGCRAACGGGASQPGHSPSSSSRSSGVLDWSWSGGVGSPPVWSLESCVVGVAGLLPCCLRLSPAPGLSHQLPFQLPRRLVSLVAPGGGPCLASLVPALWSWPLPGLHSGLRVLVCICFLIKFICFLTYGCAGSSVVVCGLSLVVDSRRCSDCGAQALAVAASLLCSTGSG